MKYRVELDYTYTGVYFDFNDFGEAMNFMGMAIESGTRFNDDGTPSKKIKATIEEVDD